MMIANSIIYSNTKIIFGRASGGEELANRDLRRTSQRNKHNHSSKSTIVIVIQVRVVVIMIIIVIIAIIAERNGLSQGRVRLGEACRYAIYLKLV